MYLMLSEINTIRFPYITFMGIRGSPNPIICTYVCLRDEKAQTP